MVVFFLFYIISILFTLSCNDWFMIWVGLEINMMSFIALMYKRTSSGVEVCMKYFFIQSLGSGILMMMFYSEFDWFDYMSLTILSYKIGSGPFFFWFPMICDNLSWWGCFMLMTVQKLLPLLLMSFLVSMFLWMIILTSILVGAIGSMNQNKMKRLMAYSSIHHVGWILTSNFMNESFWFIYLIIYSLMIMGLIYMLSKDKIIDSSMLSKMTSKWGFVLGMMSMGGMPPFIGFYLKWWLFIQLMVYDYSIFIIMVMMSVMMFYVYLRVVYSLIMGVKSEMSWKVYFNNTMFMNLDLLYIVGINLGIVVWMMIM